MARTAFLFPQKIALFLQGRLLMPFVTGNFSRNLPRGTEESLKKKPIGTRSYGILQEYMIAFYLDDRE
jgi:hypothetical protein